MITHDSVDSVDRMKQAAVKICALGARAVVVKGGHLEGDAVDVVYDGREFHYLTSKRIETKNTHGTGCTYSSAIAVYLAEGRPLLEAVRMAKAYITGAIEHALEIGRGAGPIGHFYELYRKAGVYSE